MRRIKIIFSIICVLLSIQLKGYAEGLESEMIFAVGESITYDRASLINDDFTFSTWFKLNESESLQNATLFSINSGKASTVKIGINKYGELTFFASAYDAEGRIKGFVTKRENVAAVPAFFREQAEFSDERYMHIVLTREYDDASFAYTYKIYLNGRKFYDKKQLRVGEYADKFLEKYITLNADTSSSDGTACTYSDTVIYDKVLGDDEAAQLYTSSRDKYYGSKTLELGIQNSKKYQHAVNLVDYSEFKEWKNTGAEITHKVLNSDMNYSYIHMSENSHVYIPAKDIITPDISFETWFNPSESEGGSQGIFSLHNGSSHGFALKTNKSGHIYAYGIDGVLVYQHNNLFVQRNKWYHLVLTRDYDSENGEYVYKLYADGILLSNIRSGYESGYEEPADESEYNILINSFDRIGSGGQSIEASYMDTAIYKAVLTADEIKEHYNQKAQALK